jgi:hypothetical protein
MKTWISAIILAALLCTSGAADACHKGAKTGMRGKITGVGSTSFTMTVGHRNKSQSMVVNLSRGTSVTGITAFNSSIVGETAVVEGPVSGNAINATSVKISAAEHHKKTT